MEPKSYNVARSYLRRLANIKVSTWIMMGIQLSSGVFNMVILIAMPPTSPFALICNMIFSSLVLSGFFVGFWFMYMDIRYARETRRLMSIEKAMAKQIEKMRQQHIDMLSGRNVAENE